MRIDTDTLLAHADFLRNLARSLVRDAQQADDVVQQTYAAAIERGPRPRDPRSWLGAVAKNFALMARRGDQRRRRRERVAARPELVEPDVAERMETQRRVVEAVQTLEEPYRTTVVRRFYDDWTPKEIARREGVPTKTVHTRLRRALELLRARLDRRHRGWQGALLPLLTPRSPSAAAAVLVHAGALIMKTWIVCAVALVGAAVLLVTQWDREPSPGQRAGREAETTPNDREREPAGAEERSAVGPAETGARRRAAPGKGARHLLRGRIRLPDGVTGPVAVEVSALNVYGQVDGDSATRTVAGDAPFSMPVEKLITNDRARELEVRVDHADCLPARHRVELNPGAEEVLPAVDIDLQRAAVVTGRVVDAGDGAAAGAAVAVFRTDADGAPEAGPVDSARTDANGRYRLRTGRTGPHLVAAAATGFLPAHGSVALTVGDEVEAASLVLRRGLTISGRITINGRAPNATVFGSALLSPGGGLLSWLRLGWKDGRMVRCAATARCDPNGDFRIAGLVPGTYRVAAKDLQGAHPDLDQGPERPVREVEAPAGGVHIDLPVSRLRLLVLADGAPAGRSGVLVTGRSSMHVVTDAQGRADLAVSPDASHDVQVWRAGFKQIKKRIEAPPAGRSREIILELERERPLGSGQVRFEAGDGVDADSLPAVAGFGFFEAESKSKSPSQWRDPVAKNGVFSLRGLTPGRHRLVVRPGVTWHEGLSCWRPAETRVVIPDGDEVAITIPIQRGGLIRIVARAPDGTPVRGPCTVSDDGGRKMPVTFHSDGGTVQSTTWIDDGPTDVGPALPAGTYTVELSAAGYRSATRHVRVEIGRTTELAFALVPE